jgi:hypothetical protein
MAQASMRSHGWIDEQMNFGSRRLLSWPLVLAVVFFSIPILLAVSYPTSFWSVTDYETLGLADALNLAYRLADWEMYKAVGISYHPGVPFYLLSWLGLALAGYPVASAPNFFNTVIEHVENYHRIIIYLGAFVGAAGVYFFARTARKLVPIGVAVAGLLIWSVSTPATLLSFMSPGIDAFALLINGLFLAVMVPLAYEEDIDPAILVFAGCVGALAYMNKLSYLYIPLALSAAIFMKLVFCRAGWTRGASLLSVYFGTTVLVVLAVAFLIIGWDGFRDLLSYHKSVILGSELYGTGSHTVVTEGEIWRAIAAIPADRAYAVPIALIGGAGLVIAGFVTGLRRASQIPVAVISIGTGVAALLSALIVIKHYAPHYTAGVSATLPACVVCSYLLAKSWGFASANSRGLRIAGAGLVATVISVMALQVKAPLIYTLASRTNGSQLAKADFEEISSYLAGSKRAVEFAYKSPFALCGEGFVILYASVPRLTYDYLQSRQQAFSSMLASLVTRDVGAYVIDKGYFRDVESVKAAPNLALLDPKPVRYNDGDRLIELRTVFLLIRG